jgi:hypothetical protein
MSEGSPASTRLHTWLRGLLAGPLALVAACLVMAGGAIWIPPGSAQVNNLVMPIVLFPLLWTAVFLYACMDRNLTRAYSVIGLLSAANAVLVTWHFMK